jgi:hypothetical protein
LKVIQGIRVAKFYAWEESYLKVISDIRIEELSIMKVNLVLHSVMSFIWGFLPTLVSIASFGLFMLRGLELTPEIAFTSLTLVLKKNIYFRLHITIIFFKKVFLIDYSFV